MTKAPAEPASRRPTVVLCADPAYRIPLAVVVASLARHHRSSVLTIVVLHQAISETDRATISALAGAHEVTWREPDQAQLAGSRLPAHLPTAALFRLLAPSLLPGTDRFVYLDTDVVVRDDLAPLVELDLDGHPVAAVQDAWIEVAGAPNGPPHAELAMAPTAPYFNSGVMVVDGRAWHEEGIVEDALALLGRHRLPYADQCALNAVLEGRWLPVHPRWNLQTAHGTSASHGVDPWAAIDVADALADPAVVHFTGTKPWQADGVTRAGSWFDVLADTPYAAEVADERDRRLLAAPPVAAPSGVVARLRHELGSHPGLVAAGRTAAGRARSFARRGGIDVRRVGAPRHRVQVDPALVERVVRQTGRVVADGPFRGLVIADEESWGGTRDLVPKLLGTYEQELTGVVEEIVDWAPDRVVNLGCADGYYAVGMARRLPDALVVGVDIVSESLRIAAVTAAANGVTSTTSFLASMDEVPDLDPPGRTAWLVDIEGAEATLAADPWPGRLGRDLLLVECHDFVHPGVTGLLAEAYRATHEIEVVRQGARDPNAIPLLRDVAEPDRWIALSEGRPRPMHWMVLRPRT